MSDSDGNGSEIDDNMDDDFSNSEGGSDNEEPDDPAIDLENQFYTATDEMEEGKAKDALASFRKTIKMETELLKNKEAKVKAAKWSFKSYCEIVTLNITLFKQKKATQDDVVKAFKDMLAYKGDDVNDNFLSRAITKVLETVKTVNDANLEAAVYEATDGGNVDNKKIWLKTNMMKATGHLNGKRYDDLKASLKELEKFVYDDGAKSDQLLDIYLLEIQMYMDQSDKFGVKRIYDKAIKIVEGNKGLLTSKLPIFQFCGGRIMMEDGDFDSAYAALYDAFKYLQDIGHDLRIPCLKYMLVANMLKEAKKLDLDSDEKGAEVQAKINPFDSKDVAQMRTHPQIEPVAQLLDAYEKNNIRAFERILRENPKEITSDAFLQQFVSRLLTKVRIAKILEMVKPYTRINTQFLATQLTIDREDVEELLVRLVLDNEIEGKINQTAHILVLQGHADSAARYRAIEKWSTQLQGVSRAISGSVF